MDELFKYFLKQSQSFFYNFVVKIKDFLAEFSVMLFGAHDKEERQLLVLIFCFVFLGYTKYPLIHKYKCLVGNHARSSKG